MDALEARNRMSHTYDISEFERIIEDIKRRYLSAFDQLHRVLQRLAEEE